MASFIYHLINHLINTASSHPYVFISPCVSQNKSVLNWTQVCQLLCYSLLKPEKPVLNNSWGCHFKHFSGCMSHSNHWIIKKIKRVTSIIPDIFILKWLTPFGAKIFWVLHLKCSAHSIFSIWFSDRISLLFSVYKLLFWIK